MIFSVRNESDGGIYLIEKFFEMDLFDNKKWEPQNTFVLFEVLAEGINRHLLW